MGKGEAKAKVNMETVAAEPAKAPGAKAPVGKGEAKAKVDVVKAAMTAKVQRHQDWGKRPRRQGAWCGHPPAKGLRTKRVVFLHRGLAWAPCEVSVRKTSSMVCEYGLSKT